MPLSLHALMGGFGLPRASYLIVAGKYLPIGPKYLAVFPSQTGVGIPPRRARIIEQSREQTSTPKPNNEV